MDRLALKQRIQSIPIIRNTIRHLVLSPVRFYLRWFPIRLGKRAIWHNIACHLHWLEAPATAKTVFRAKLLVDPDEDVGRCIYYFGIWEPNLTAWISRSLSPGDIFVDVGANVGYFSLLAAEIVKDRGSVVSIEAMPRTCEVLEANFRMNGIRNGRVVGMAVWNAEGNIELFGPCEGTSGKASTRKAQVEKWNFKGRFVVPCAPLSSIVTAEETKGARIVKIDVEGAEWQAAQGMSCLIERGRQDLEIAVEVNPDSLHLQGLSCEDFHAFFRKFGFHVYQIENLYGDLSDISLRPPAPPRRIERIPENEQSDIIFSRRNGDVL